MTREMIIQQLAMVYIKKTDLAQLSPKQVVKKYHQIVKQMKAEDRQLHKDSKQKTTSHPVGFH